AETARARLHEQQPQLGGPLVLVDAEDRPDRLPVDLGDPAPVPARVAVLDVLGDDPGDQRLELLVPAVLLGVELAVALHDPPEIAGPQIAELDPRPRAVAGEQPLDRPHRPDQPVLAGSGQPAQQGGDIVAGAGVEVAERVPAGRGQPDDLPPGVGGVAFADDEAVGLEPGQDPAEVAGVETQPGAKVGDPDAAGLGELEEDPR